MFCIFCFIIGLGSVCAGIQGSSSNGVEERALIEAFEQSDFSVALDGLLERETTHKKVLPVGTIRRKVLVRGKGLYVYSFNGQILEICEKLHK
jgi:hypothetical protein